MNTPSPATYVGAEAIRLAKLVLLAQTYAQAERERINDLYSDVLAAGYYTVRTDEGRRAYPDAGQRITDPAKAWTMADEQFPDYHAKCGEAIRAAGYTVPEGHCPALIAETQRNAAERLFIEHMAGRLGMTPDQTERIFYRLETIKQFLDLNLGLIVTHHMPKGKQAAAEILDSLNA